MLTCFVHIIGCPCFICFLCTILSIPNCEPKAYCGITISLTCTCTVCNSFARSIHHAWSFILVKEMCVCLPSCRLNGNMRVDTAWALHNSILAMMVTGKCVPPARLHTLKSSLHPTFSKTFKCLDEDCLKPKGTCSGNRWVWVMGEHACAYDVHTCRGGGNMCASHGIRHGKHGMYTIMVGLGSCLQES